MPIAKYDQGLTFGDNRIVQLAGDEMYTPIHADHISLESVNGKYYIMCLYINWGDYHFAKYNIETLIHKTCPKRVIEAFDRNHLYINNSTKYCMSQAKGKFKSLNYYQGKRILSDKEKIEIFHRKELNTLAKRYAPLICHIAKIDPSIRPGPEDPSIIFGIEDPISNFIYAVKHSI